MRKIIQLIIIIFILSGVFAAVPQITQVTYDPSPAIPGTTTTLIIQLENKDSITQENVTISIPDEYPFMVKEESTKNIGNIIKYGKATAKFTIYVDPSAENKTYTLPIEIKTKSASVPIKTPHQIIVSGNEPELKVIDVSEERLIPGQEKEIELTIQNVGTSPAYAITMEIQEDRTVTATGTVIEREITPLGASTKYIEKIMPGEQAKTRIKLSVNRNATLKNYMIPIKLLYRDSSGEWNEDRSYIGIKISGTVDLDATIKEYTNGELTIEIFNKGAGKAEYMFVEINVQGTIEKPKQFIGSLEPNDIDTVKTKATLIEKDTIVLNITYQDTDATIKTKQITLTANNKTTPTEQPNVLLTAIILLVIIAIIYLGYRKFIKK